jgi:peptidoglycan/LPS O-acetylase OafA/YrhL
MKRYEALDALRGVAALSVVVFHLGQVKLEPGLVPHGYLAVDFFFVLSGFVVAHAYEAALRDKLTWRAFTVKRVIRLYPLALLGVLVGTAVLLLKWRLFPEKVDPLSTILASSAINSFLLPNLFGGVVSKSEFFPGNGPLWSLFFEMVINLLWAAIGVRLRTTYLALFALASGAALIVLADHQGTLNIGFDAATFVGGVARVCFSFPVGVIIYRLHFAGRLPEISFGTALLGLLLVVIFSQSLFSSRLPLWDLLSVLVLFPLIVVAGINDVERSSRIGLFLGELSYPVYVLHFPVLLVFSGLRQSAPLSVNGDLLSVAAVVAAVTLSWTAFWYYDRPLRRRLSDLASKAFAHRSSALGV